jgi:RNA polymerase sigma factor (TIGR02999 family)
VPGDVTDLLSAWTNGDAEALQRLVPLVYSELHRIATGHMRRERADHNLQATALIHEAYLKLVNCNRMTFESRAHFFAVCAQLMRRILIDIARSHSSGKRGSGFVPVALDETVSLADVRGKELISLDDALQALAKLDDRKSRVVEMRFFGGMTNEEAAAVLGVSQDTVMRDWQFARSWLRQELSTGAG